MIQRTLSISIGDTVTGIQAQVTLSAEGEAARIVPIPEAAETEVDFGLEIARAEYLFIVADKALTINTNAAADGAPDDTLELVAGVPIVWTADSGQVNPFTANVTSLFVTNDGADAATLRILAGIDATPSGS
jgi:hypothetical protein